MLAEGQSGTGIPPTIEKPIVCSTSSVGKSDKNSTKVANIEDVDGIRNFSSAGEDPIVAYVSFGNKTNAGSKNVNRETLSLKVQINSPHLYWRRLVSNQKVMAIQEGIESLLLGLLSQKSKIKRKSL